MGDTHLMSREQLHLPCTPDDSDEAFGTNCQIDYTPQPRRHSSSSVHAAFGVDHHDLGEWLEREFLSRLMEIDRKLDAVVAQVAQAGCCQREAPRCRGDVTSDATAAGSNGTATPLRAPQPVPAAPPAWSSEEPRGPRAPALAEAPLMVDMPPLTASAPEVLPERKESITQLSASIQPVLLPRDVEGRQWSEDERKSDEFGIGPHANSARTSRDHNHRFTPGRKRSTRSFRSEMSVGISHILRGTASVTAEATVQKIASLIDDPRGGNSARVYQTCVNFFVVASLVPTLIQTLDDPPLHEHFYAVVEVLLEVFFVLDAAARFIVWPRKVLYLTYVHNVIDILCILPLGLRLSLGLVLEPEEKESLPGSLLLYVVPMLRLLKALRGFPQFNLIFSTLLRVYAETWPTMLVLLYVVLFYATLLYYAEPRSNIDSYWTAVWFVLVSLTTVGYGDVGPTTTAGYVIASVLVASTMFVMAVPLGIIGSAVAEIWQERETILLRQWVRDKLSEWGYTGSDVRCLFAAFDKDNNGFLDFDEFQKIMAGLKVQINETRLVELFETFDMDHNGSIEIEEFINKLFPGS